MLMVSSSSSLLPSRSRSKDGGVRLQQQRQRHRASGLREGPRRRARLRPRPRRLGGLPRAGGTLSEEEEEEQELLLSEEVFERKGCMLLVSMPTQRPRPDDSAFHFVHQSSADSSRAALCTVYSLSRQDSASCFAFRVKKKGKREGRERERERDDWSSKIWGKTLTVAPVLASRVGCCCSGDHAPRAAVRALVSCERFRPRTSADAAGKHRHRPGVFEERKRERARALMIDDASEVFSFFSSSPRKTVSEESALPPVFDRSTSPASSSRLLFFSPSPRANLSVSLRFVSSSPVRQQRAPWACLTAREVEARARARATASSFCHRRCRRRRRRLLLPPLDLVSPSLLFLLTSASPCRPLAGSPPPSPARGTPPGTRPTSPCAPRTSGGAPRGSTWPTRAGRPRRRR